MLLEVMQQVLQRVCAARVAEHGNSAGQQWAERLGIDCHIIHTRLYLGKDERTAVLQPVRHHHPK